MRSRSLLLAVLLTGMAGGTALAQPYYPSPGYAPPYAPPPPPGYYPPPPPPPGYYPEPRYYPEPGPGYGPPPRVPVGFHCDAPIESPWGRQQLICDIPRPRPAGSRCICPGSPGAPPVPGRVVR